MPVLEDTDVQRVLLAWHDAATTRTTLAVPTATRNTAVNDPTQRELPLGSLAGLFAAGNETALDAVCCAAATAAKQRAPDRPIMSEGRVPSIHEMDRQSEPAA